METTFPLLRHALSRLTTCQPKLWVCNRVWQQETWPSNKGVTQGESGSWEYLLLVTMAQSHRRLTPSSAPKSLMIWWGQDVLSGIKAKNYRILEIRKIASRIAQQMWPWANGPGSTASFPECYLKPMFYINMLGWKMHILWRLLE